MRLTLPKVASGRYAVIACADDPNTTFETDEANNCRATAVTVVAGGL